ncbi:MAG: hypothetical protein V9G10_12980 [Candidatus Nanopelagicales bacterium]
MECALACPDAAIPNAVHEIHDLLLTGIERAGHHRAAAGRVARARRTPLSEQVREAYRQDKTARPFHEVVAEAGAGIDCRPARHCAATSTGSWPSCATLPGGADPPLLRCDGELGGPGTGGAVLGHHRPVEVHRLPGVHRRVRPRRPDRHSMQDADAARRRCRNGSSS